MGDTSSLITVFLCVVSYIIPWRIACYIKFRKVWWENNNHAI